MQEYFIKFTQCVDCIIYLWIFLSASLLLWFNVEKKYTFPLKFCLGQVTFFFLICGIGTEQSLPILARGFQRYCVSPFTTLVFCSFWKHIIYKISFFILVPKVRSHVKQYSLSSHPTSKSVRVQQRENQ